MNPQAATLRLAVFPRSSLLVDVLLIVAGAGLVSLAAQIEIPLGFILGAVCAVGLWVLYRTTRFGFEVNVIADAPDAARYAGMRTRRKVLAVLALSGAAAGLGGAADVGSVRHILDPKGLSQAGYGYTGIVVAALARLNPIAVVFVSVLIVSRNCRNS